MMDSKKKTKTSNRSVYGIHIFEKKQISDVHVNLASGNQTCQWKIQHV